MSAQVEEPGLTHEVQSWLLRLARDAIAAHLIGAAAPHPSEVPSPAQQRAGCFVSLHLLDGSLRGCIGTFTAQSPLWENVMEMAVAAATRDPRFPALTSDELAQCRLEISALSRPRPGLPEDVQVGRHGLQISGRGRRGVLLPQVASSRGWDRETFLSQVCIKAGLPPSAWREPNVALELFEAQVFDEEEA